MKYTKQTVNNFLEEFNIYRDKCNKKRLSSLNSTGDKYYLGLLEFEGKYCLSIESIDINANEFLTLGYFYDLGDIQIARTKYQDKILQFYRQKLLKG